MCCACVGRGSEVPVPADECPRGAADAMQHGFAPKVVAQACGDRNQEFHLSNLLDLEAKYADVISLSEALRHLGGG